MYLVSAVCRFGRKKKKKMKNVYCNAIYRYICRKRERDKPYTPCDMRTNWESTLFGFIILYIILLLLFCEHNYSD